MSELKIVRNFHDMAGDTMAYVAPILAPVLSAIAVYAGLVADFGVIAAVIGAMAIEGLGFASVRLVLRTKEETDSRVLWGSAIAMMLIYLGAVYGILATTHLEAYTMAFPLLTVTGALAYGVNSELERRKAAPVDQAKAEIDLAAYRRIKQAESRAEAKRLSMSASTNVSTVDSQQASTRERPASVDDLRRYYVDNPKSTTRQAAAALGRSKSWVAKWRSQATDWQTDWDDEDQLEFIYIDGQKYWTVDDISRPLVALRLIEDEKEKELRSSLWKRYNQLVGGLT